MSIDEILENLKREFPNGVSFEPMAMRLWRQKIPLADDQIEAVKSRMFQREGGLWFFTEMVVQDATQSDIQDRALNWLVEYQCFSVERLWEKFRNELRNISTTEDFAVLLRHLGITVVAKNTSGLLGFDETDSAKQQ